MRRQPLNLGSPDTATCTTTHERPAGSDEVTATYSGDANYAGSSGTTSETSTKRRRSPRRDGATFTKGSEGSFTVTASGTPTPTISRPARCPKA